RESVVEFEEVPVFADAGGWLAAVAEGAILVAMAASYVKALQRETGGIDAGMAGITEGLIAVLGELFADGFGAAGVWFDGRNAGGGRRHGVAKDSLGDPDATEDGR